MVGDGGSSAGSYLAAPTSPIPSHCAVITLFKSGPSASIVVTSTLREQYLLFAIFLYCMKKKYNAIVFVVLSCIVLWY